MKDTFYFPHDYNCRTDVKIKKLIRVHGPLGYGVFWMLIEDLYNNANALPLDYEGIAYELRCDIDVIESIINDFELFEIDGDVFGSLSVEKRLNERTKKSEKARESASKRWGNKDNDTDAMRSHSDSNARKKGKERKEINETKETDALPVDDVLSTDVGSAAAGFSFEELISVYPKVDSHKVETKALFNELSSTDKEKCITFAKHLQQIWKQHGDREKYQYMKSCHKFVEDKMFNGKPEDILPAGTKTEIVELKEVTKDPNWKKQYEEYLEKNKHKYLN